MTSKKSIDKIAQILDLLDKHIHEENCGHSSKELLREYEEMNDCLIPVIDLMRCGSKTTFTHRD